MFGPKDRRLSGQTSSGPQETGQSHIAKGMSVQGDLSGDIDLLLDGRLEGNIRCRSVTVGMSGEVVGSIVAQEAVVNGRVEGSIDAKTVRLNASSEMIGDVHHDVIEVAAGARIDGRYSRMDGKPAAKPQIKSSHKTETAAAPPKSPAPGRIGDKAAKDSAPTSNSADLAAAGAAVKVN